MEEQQKMDVEMAAVKDILTNQEKIISMLEKVIEMADNKSEEDSSEDEKEENDKIGGKNEEKKVKRRSPSLSPPPQHQNRARSVGPSFRPGGWQGPSFRQGGQGQQQFRQQQFRPGQGGPSHQRQMFGRGRGYAGGRIFFAPNRQQNRWSGYYQQQPPQFFRR